MSCSVPQTPHYRGSELRKDVFTQSVSYLQPLCWALYSFLYSYLKIYKGNTVKGKNLKTLIISIGKCWRCKKIIITLSHDIRGYLSAIKGRVELAKDSKDRKRRNAYLDNILNYSGISCYSGSVTFEAG